MDIAYHCVWSLSLVATLGLTIIWDLVLAQTNEDPSIVGTSVHDRKRAARYGRADVVSGSTEK